MTGFLELAFAVGNILLRGHVVEIGHIDIVADMLMTLELAFGLHLFLQRAQRFEAGADVGLLAAFAVDLLLARTPEEVRADGGIAHLWGTAGGPSVEIEEIDYAEVLREKQGDAATIERVIAAALAGPQLELDDSAMRTLLEIVGDPGRLNELMKQLDAATADKGVDARTAAFLPAFGLIAQLQSLYLEIYA